MKRAGSLKEMHATWQLLRRTVRVMGKARQKELDEYGVSGDATAVMFTIVQLGEKAIPAAIARQLLLEPHSVSQLVTRLQKDGLARRLRDLEIKNQVRIELTQKGREIYRKAMERRSVRKMMAVLTEEEREQLWSSLAKLRAAALKQIGVRPDHLYPPANRAEFFGGPKRAEEAPSMRERGGERVAGSNGAGTD